MVYLITGKAGAGKTHYARELMKELREEGGLVTMIDRDEFRKKEKNQDFSDAGRERNLIHAAELAKRYEMRGYSVVMTFVAPRRAWRDAMRGLWRTSRVIHIPGGTLWKGTAYERPTADELMTLSLYTAGLDQNGVLP